MNILDVQGLRRATIDFVVTGTPRSGTTYVARVLKKAGFDCLHERRFNPWEISIDTYRLCDRSWGDSSWLAAPFLDILPERTKVFHVVREPLKTVNSIIGTGQIDWPDDYRTFIARHCWGDDNYWPSDVASDAQVFWVRWNEMVERSGRVAMRFRVEDMATALPAIMSEVGGPKLTDERIAAILEQVHTDVNSRRHRSAVRLTTDDLSLEFRETARRYGYDY